MTRLHDLYREQGQSPWLDDLKRSYLEDGALARLVDDGIRGVTSNPTIFAKAISGEDTYDEEFAELARKESVVDAYWRLVMDDVAQACGLLQETHAEADGGDGFVSLEVAPDLAHDTAGTVQAAKWIHATIDRPNLLVKIPATREGVPAIQEMIAAGKSINVTLIFGLERYADVIEAYLAGLEALVGSGGDPRPVASVASFFVSRVDTETDRRLEAIGTEEALALRGKAAVANAKLAYRLFQERFSGPRWEALAAKGARPQRPLWASTSTKNPAYPDLLYVETLIGPHTVNTMPEATIRAFEDHGTVACTVDQNVDGARATIDALGRVGVDFADVSRTLEDEGVASFAKSFDELLQALTDKANALTGGEAEK
ncbi:MAG TPA: transaldolase [Acidimicrobiales bacterium]